jgi:hypothetical protein
VQDGEDHVDFGLRARLGQDGARAPLALFIDKVPDYLVLGWVEALDYGLGGAQGDFVLAAAAAVDHGYA